MTGMYCFTCTCLKNFASCQTACRHSGSMQRITARLTVSCIEVYVETQRQLCRANVIRRAIFAFDLGVQDSPFNSRGHVQRVLSEVHILHDHVWGCPCDSAMLQSQRACQFETVMMTPSVHGCGIACGLKVPSCHHTHDSDGPTRKNIIKYISQHA